jgi:predicted transcriptional regulator
MKIKSAISQDIDRKSTVSQRRSNIEIIADMLRVGEGGAGKTEIMYSANMSYYQIQKYLEYLVGEGFINKMEVGNSVGAYRVTESGLKLLKAIDSLLEMLGQGKKDGDNDTMTPQIL